MLELNNMNEPAISRIRQYGMPPRVPARSKEGKIIQVLLENLEEYGTVDYNRFLPFKAQLKIKIKEIIREFV
jgi:hypothetical protein